MARHIWDLDDLRYRFGLARFGRRRPGKPEPSASHKGPGAESACPEQARRPEGIVEANRRARREKRALRDPG